MIIGIGIDFVNIVRISKLYVRYPTALLNKTLSEAETKKLSSIQQEPRRIQYIAKRFAAKEALVKALGTGFRKEVSLRKVSVMNRTNGQPYYVLEEALEHYVSSLFKLRRYALHLSISDDKDNAVAVAVLEAHEFYN
jgi:holo-[acyl-carrier protein] synthase